MFGGKGAETFPLLLGVGCHDDSPTPVWRVGSRPADRPGVTPTQRTQDSDRTSVVARPRRSFLLPLLPARKLGTATNPGDSVLPRTTLRASPQCRSPSCRGGSEDDGPERSPGDWTERKGQSRLQVCGGPSSDPGRGSQDPSYTFRVGRGLLLWARARSFTEPDTAGRPLSAAWTPERRHYLPSGDADGVGAGGTETVRARESVGTGETRACAPATRAVPESKGPSQVGGGQGRRRCPRKEPLRPDRSPIPARSSARLAAPYLHTFASSEWHRAGPAVTGPGPRRSGLYQRLSRGGAGGEEGAGRRWRLLGARLRFRVAPGRHRDAGSPTRAGRTGRPLRPATVKEGRRPVPAPRPARSVPYTSSPLPCPCCPNSPRLGNRLLPRTIRRTYPARTGARAQCVAEVDALSGRVGLRGRRGDFTRPQWHRCSSVPCPRRTSSGGFPFPRCSDRSHDRRADTCPGTRGGQQFGTNFTHLRLSTSPTGPSVVKFIASPQGSVRIP